MFQLDSSGQQCICNYYKTKILPSTLHFINDFSLQKPGFFIFDSNLICYGITKYGISLKDIPKDLCEYIPEFDIHNSLINIHFNPFDIVENLRLERYYSQNTDNKKYYIDNILNNIYYFLRPLIPISIRKYLQRFRIRGWEKIVFPKWPVDTTVDCLFERLLALTIKSGCIKKLPFIWFWPEGASGCATVTHDVETSTGLNFCSFLMELDASFGIHSSFQLVPEQRYEIPSELLSDIRRSGFEVNIHDLNHDGHLFDERNEFLRRAVKINGYAETFGARGFRSGVLYRNLEWFDALTFSYDMSVPNVAHLDPQRGGCCTVMPYFIGNILELPLSTTQDYTLFHILGEYSINLWKKQIDLILEKNGLISFNIHPDYIIAPRAREVYEKLLAYLGDLRSLRNIWITLPGEVDRWWRQRSRMELVSDEGGWRLEGPGSHRARVAYARLDGDRLVYEIDSNRSASPNASD